MSLSYDNSQAYAEFRKQLIALQDGLGHSAQRVVSQQAEIGLAATKKNTPVGVYDKNVSFLTSDGKWVNFETHGKKVGGTLRRGWQKDPTHKDGNTWVSGYSNNVKYGMYVNNGHRIVSKGITWGYVKGVRMLEKGVTQGREQVQTLFDAELARVKAQTGF